jgi:hypothetical protein
MPIISPAAFERLALFMLQLFAEVTCSGDFRNNDTQTAKRTAFGRSTARAKDPKQHIRMRQMTRATDVLTFL